ncbi:MAG: type I pullulanase [Bacteroidaceae bacterium]|nr:type I pullulanase [Bacteroidaceae bacterium]
MKRLLKKTLMAALFGTSVLATHAQDLKSLPIPVGPISEMTYTPAATHFSLWAPLAADVVVNLYSQGDGGAVEARHHLEKHSDGTWALTVREDLLGKFFTFEVFGKGQSASYGETPGLFAKAVGVNGARAQVVDLAATNPDGWECDHRPPLKDFSEVIIYEMHHRDFSMDVESGIKNRGKYLALTEKGTKNAQGLSTGIDHLKELGVNHVHILPSYDYGSVNEAQNLLAQTDERVPQQYNWGYDPVNYNVPEGSYSTNPYDPVVRIREFKQMVQALHQAGIRVVLDVVYNHVFDAASSQFDKVCPGYFFRHKGDGTLSDGSGCGNETASEMPMMRKYMVESVLYWLKEYHIDGFRFDLMGVHDIETMNAIREAVDAVDPTIFIYGEGWAASAPVLPEEQLGMKANMVQMRGIAAFGDEMRDGLRGGWQDDKEGAFLIGEIGHEESIKFGMVGAINHPEVDMSKVNYSHEAWAAEPTQMISYVSCHDDMCLADRVRTTLAEKNKKEGKSALVSIDERLRLQKLAETAVLTSQGVPFIWCGDEILRDKKGVHNSYNSPDSVNTILWENKTEYQDLFDYVRTLVAVRKAHPVFHMGSADAVRKHLHFLPYKGANVIACQLDGAAVGDEWQSVVVIFNGRKKAVRVSVPQGVYTIVAQGGKISLTGLGTIKGKTVTVPAQSALIMHQSF